MLTLGVGCSGTSFALMMASAASWTATENFRIESWVLIEDIVDRNEIVRGDRELCSAIFVRREDSRALGQKVTEVS